MSNPGPPSFDWTLWLKWVLVSTLGWVVGWAFVGEVGIGAVVGILQWLVLRPLVRQAGWWILGTAVGWAAGAAVIVVLLPPGVGVLGGAVLGATLGMMQWFILRRQVYRAGWWIVISTLGWALGLTGVIGTSLVGAVVGAVTGLALELLLRHPHLKT